MAKKIRLGSGEYYPTAARHDSRRKLHLVNMFICSWLSVVTPGTESACESLILTEEITCRYAVPRCAWTNDALFMIVSTHCHI